MRLQAHEVEVKDSPRLHVRRGDLIRIPDTEVFPKIAREQFAVVLSRYRYDKTWPGDKKVWFRDYGCEVLFITGVLKGQVRRYYGKIFSSYKYIN